MRACDAFTIANEPIASIDLMERAALSCVKYLKTHHSLTSTFVIICGPGNNGGDWLAIARLLSAEGAGVKVYADLTERCSEDFKLNFERLPQALIKSVSTFEVIETPKCIIIDALYGSGLSRKLQGRDLELVAKINASECQVIAIDVPSGLNADGKVYPKEYEAVHADVTLSLELPKLALLLPGFQVFSGDMKVIPIGLHQGFISKQHSDYEYFTRRAAQVIYRPKAQFSHKGTNGHALIVAGSKGKMGAALMAGESCLRSGAGLLSMLVPQEGRALVQTRLPEAMLENNEGAESLSGLYELNYSYVGVGPGIGLATPTRVFLKSLLSTYIPMVIDADALNIIAEEKWQSLIPKNSILTPHPKEFSRLVGSWSTDLEKLEKLRSFAISHQIIVVLKGAYTAVATPAGQISFNSTGNPGMATGGTGDILTGILTGLLAQGYAPVDAARFGVFLHGLAGDLAASAKSMEALIATDLIAQIGSAFRTVQQGEAV